MNKNLNYKGISVEPVSLLIGTALALFRKGRDKGLALKQKEVYSYIEQSTKISLRSKKAG